jgi:DNA polymerase elongation subunit (family B)
MGVAQREGGMALWWRKGGRAVREDIDFAPFFLLSHRQLLDDFKPTPKFIELSGENHFKWRVEFESWAEHDEALTAVNKHYRSHKSEFENEVSLSNTDAVTQYLLDSGRTHFKGQTLDDLAVLYIALRGRNSGGADYADPRERGDNILLLGLSDGRGWDEVLDCADLSEAELIDRLSAIIAERDPDVICGHDLFKGSLAYIVQRAKLAKCKLGWGRDASPVRVRSSRAPAAEKQLEYPRADVNGRHLVDTWFLTIYYDIVKRDLERFDAPYVARYLDHSIPVEGPDGLPDPLEAWDYERLYETDHRALLADLHCELRACQQILHTLGGSYFAQAQMLPLSLQDCVVRGNGVKINLLLMREYLRRREAIPAPVESRTIVGGFTELRRTGLIHDVLNVDMASLYPSIMLKHGIQPGSDSGDVFQPLLAELTRQRLAAKKIAKESKERRERVLADARQGAFKIFINSFFGYLGTDRMNWADPQQGEFITRNGQFLVQTLAKAVEDLGGSVIEIDTDGVYFTAPQGCGTEEQQAELEKKLNAALPEGIRAELGECYPTMLSHKVKNYALLSANGEITVKGSGMKSRGLEPFLHAFIQAGIEDILRGTPEKIEARHAELKERIKSRQMGIRELAKTDTLIESLEVYKSKTGGGGRNKAAAYEVALRAKRSLRAGDQVSYYITGEKATVKAFEAAKPVREFDPANPDYNIPYYVKKLDENLKKVLGYMTAGGEEAESGGAED